MTVISVTDISLSFGASELFSRVSFALESGDRLGIVGPNGCGKSTLLSILLGETEADSGTVFTAAGATMGILTQDGAYDVFENTGISALEQMYAAFPEHLAAERRMEELEAWLNGYKEAQNNIIPLLRSMMDGR